MMQVGIRGCHLCDCVFLTCKQYFKDTKIVAVAWSSWALSCRRKWAECGNPTCSKRCPPPAVAFSRLSCPSAAPGMHTPASTGSFVHVGGADAVSEEDFEQLSSDELHAGDGDDTCAAKGQEQAQHLADDSCGREVGGGSLEEGLPPETADSQPEPTSASSSGMVDAGSGSTSTHDVEADIKQLEAQAAKVAQDVQRAAMDYTNKLTAGFKSALGGLGASEAPSLTKLAGGLASWFLDPPPLPRQGSQVRLASVSEATANLHELLGLSQEENLVESFRCKLLQTYECSHNGLTPAIQMAFQGTLYITDQHCCFTVEERSHRLPFKVVHQEIVKAARHKPLSRKPGDTSDVLRLDLKPGSSPGGGPTHFLAFRDFEGASMDSALALVEHLMVPSN